MLSESVAESVSAIPGEPAPPPPSPAGAPEWSTFKGELQCPLCEYNLHGLAEPRCPECGYRFEWDDLLNADRKAHPYLFEHHPARNLWSFRKTWLGGLWPARFWRSLKPSQPSRPGRLVLYWVLATAPVLLGPLAMFAWVYTGEAEQEAAFIPQQRAFWITQFRSGRAAVNGLPTDPAAFQAWLDDQWPEIHTWGFARRVYDFPYCGDGRLAAALAWVAWPWLTFAALMVFQASMRRAKVRKVHVLRSVLYSCDTGLWVGLAMTFLLPESFWSGYRYGDYAARLFDLDWGGLAPVVVLSAVAAYTTYRLGTACRSYLQFDRPFATAAATQFIVMLALVTAALNKLI